MTAFSLSSISSAVSTPSAITLEPRLRVRFYYLLPVRVVC